MKVKVCGLRDNFLEVVGLQPDFAGLIFYEKSSRFVEKNQSLEVKAKLASVQKVGVFVNAEKDYIFKKIQEYNLDLVQLHGFETPEFCAAVRQKIPVIKAFGINSQNDFNRLESYLNSVDFFLFDTKTLSYGGSGEKFNWDCLKNVSISKPFFLSGGISLDDISIVKILKINNLIGVDLNSRFEISPTFKDIEKLRKAINLLKK